MNRTADSNNSCFKVSEDVITKIVELAAVDIDGVSSFANSKINFANLFVKPEKMSAIDIDVNGDSVEISLGINVLSSCKVKSVAEKVQQRIKDDVQNMTGIAVTKVNVRIEGIIFENE